MCINAVTSVYEAILCTTISMQYYPRLRDLREDMDYTQDQLVKILNMHKTTYTNYEQGKREPPFELIIKLAKLYNVSIDYIAGITDEPKPLK